VCATRSCDDPPIEELTHIGQVACYGRSSHHCG
jgi:hypothetical protein